MEKSTLLITFIFLNLSNLYAQSFGDLGTSWEYCLMEEYESPEPYVTTFSFNNISRIDNKNQIEIYNNRFDIIVDTVSFYTLDSVI